MMKDDEGWRRMIDFKVFWGFAFRRTDERTDICDCRVAFATEKVKSLKVANNTEKLIEQFLNLMA